VFSKRSLQYALEDSVNILKDDDWIVHLDEETYVLESAVLGIFDFAIKNDHPIGQGLVTYGKREVVNWLNTLADSTRVLNYCCSLFVSLKYVQKGFKVFNGSFFVVKKRVESDLSFDFGLQGVYLFLSSKTQLWLFKTFFFKIK
jgi:egghead protein (zeste-white 4 protein)